MIPAWHPRDASDRANDPGEPKTHGVRSMRWWIIVALIVLIPTTFVVWALSLFNALLAHVLPGYALNWVSTTDMREQEFRLVNSDDLGQWHLRLPRAYLSLWSPGDGRSGDQLYLHMVWPDLRPYPVAVQEMALRRPDLIGKRGTPGDRLWRLEHASGLFDRRIMVELGSPAAGATAEWQTRTWEGYRLCKVGESGIPGLVRLFKDDTGSRGCFLLGHETYAAPIGAGRYEVHIECGRRNDPFNTCSIYGSHRDWWAKLTVRRALLPEWRGILDGVLARLDAATVRIDTKPKRRLQ